MTWKKSFFFMVVFFLIYNCSPSKYLVVDKSRTLKTNDISSFHTSLSVTVGWIPYQDQKVIQTGKNEWKVVKSEEEEGSSLPMLVISYPETQDSLLLTMATENEVLGKLIKHSLMTQEQISTPYTDFFERAKCQKCHPEHIKIPFE